jgi:hypothetical protein
MESTRIIEDFTEKLHMELRSWRDRVQTLHGGPINMSCFGTRGPGSKLEIALVNRVPI